MAAPAAASAPGCAPPSALRSAALRSCPAGAARLGNAAGRPGRAGRRVSAVDPIMLLVGVVIIAAIIGVGFFLMNNGSKATPGASGSPGASGTPVASVAGNSPTAVVTQNPSGGSVVFSPSTFSCDQSVTLTITLPASVKDTDQITLKIDGHGQRLAYGPRRGHD